MKDEESLNVMARMTANGALDGEIINILRRNYDEIKEIRQGAQAAYSIKQRHLAQLMGFLPGMVGDSPRESATI